MHNPITFALQWIGWKPPITQTTQAERDCLARHAAMRKRLAEVGVFQGVTTCVLRKAMHPEGVLFGIDSFGRGRLGICFFQLIAERQVNKVKNGKVEWLAMKSHYAIDALLAKKGEPLDFVFIDGDHSYEGVKADWVGFKQLVGPGGIIALHDSRERPGFGSQQFTEEVVLKDPDFDVAETVDSLTVMKRKG
jgi:predicted O-methyltransferase YrrM